MHPPVRTVFSTADADEARAFVDTAYADNRLRVDGPVAGFRFGYRRDELGELRVDRLTNPLPTEHTIEPMAHLAVVQVLAGAVEVRTAGTTTQAVPGDVFVAVRPGVGHWSRMDRARVQVVGIDVPLLRRVDADVGPRLGRAAQHPVPDGTAARWRAAVDHLLTATAPPAGPLVLSSAGQLLAATALELFTPPPGRGALPPGRDATPAAVRLAVAFMETHPDRDLTVTEVAAAAHVGVRTLQLAFRRHRGTTPLAYLRRVRLDRAHADLVAAGPAHEETVGAVAARWGFADTSRFAAAYRTAYGRAPGQTLRD